MALRGEPDRAEQALQRVAQRLVVVDDVNDGGFPHGGGDSAALPERQGGHLIWPGAAVHKGMIAPPQVSVVIPTWNRAALVREAVASVVAQSARDWELIVVDDGSDDDTVEQLGRVADPRLRVIGEKRCGNVARLRNLGVAAGTAPLIAFLDSDDLWLPPKLDRQLEAFRASPAAGWC